MRKHFIRQHPGLNLDEEQVRYEREKHTFLAKDAYICNFAAKTKLDNTGKPCGMKFPNLQEKIQHMRKCHMDAKKIKCIAPNCAEMFNRPFEVRKHVEKKHPELHVDSSNREDKGYYYNGFDKGITRIERKDKPKRSRRLKERCCNKFGTSQQGMTIVCNYIMRNVFQKHNHLKNSHSIFWCPTCTLNFKK